MGGRGEEWRDRGRVRESGGRGGQSRDQANLQPNSGIGESEGAIKVSVRRACARGLLYSVCLSVCYRSSTSIRHSCDKMILPARSSLNSKGFQLADFAKKLSFPSYSLFFTFAWPKGPFSIIEVATVQVQLTTITYERFSR